MTSVDNSEAVYSTAKKVCHGLGVGAVMLSNYMLAGVVMPHVVTDHRNIGVWVTSATVGLFIEKLPQLAQATREIFSRQRSATLNEIAATCIAGTTLIATTIACVATGYPEHLAVAAAGLVTEFTRWVQAARESR